MFGFLQRSPAKTESMEPAASESTTTADPHPSLPSSTTAAKREFILHSQGEDGYVEVESTHTLSDVRRLVLDEFDLEQLPGGGDSDAEKSSACSGEFAFRVNGIRLSAKQESRKNAFELLDQKVRVELVPKKQKKREAEALLDDDEEESQHVKRRRLDGAGAVTPFEPGEGTKNELPINAAAADEDKKKGEDDNSTIATGSSLAGSVVAPVQLDKKFASDGIHNDGSESYDSEATMNVKMMNKDIITNADEKGTAGDEEVTKPDAKNDETADPELVKKVSMELEEDTAAGRKETAVDDVIKDIDVSLIGKKPDTLDDDIDNGFGNNDDVLDVTNEEEVSNDPHKESNIAKGKSNQVLAQLSTILRENPNFCSEPRRKEWLNDIQSLAEKSSPQTVFGVLGNTGVGKSSLLNGLLDEAAVLPTSGSRGCTAAVVELVFNAELMKEANNDDEGVTARTPIPVYRGEVELITLEDWTKELKVLVDECSTQEKNIYARPPIEDNQPDAAQAWQKIEQVYGRRSMEQYCGKSTDFVFHQLANNMRVKNLLRGTTPGQDHNTIVVEVGEATPGSEDAKELLKGWGQMKARTKREKKNWAQDFRKQINSYVYRMGNGDLPQTWPLIRKVQLKGPWSVLSTGAVLVDLPGVRDSNAARAKVAERYLQHCNQIAIVAPIKRAVDDGTAKELLGEQFKRRLLMDGQYSNVFFICTQTDDIEATETMRDHADVAQEVPGRWEKMTELADGISAFEAELHPLLQEEEDLEGHVEDAKQQLKDSLQDLKQAEDEENEEDFDDDEVDTEMLESLKAVVANNKTAYVNANQVLATWRVKHAPTINSIQSKCDRLQKKLKALCSGVRNEYSKSCLQADFKSGLKELYRKDDDDDGNGNDGGQTHTALPDNFEMDVFCISANDYLKLMKIKPSRDGPPSTFSAPRDTQIPQLRQYVHETTASFCKTSVKSFVENTQDMLDQMKLLAADADDVPTGRSAFRMKSLFETAMRDLASQVEPIAGQFEQVLDAKIQRSLVSSLQTGAQKGSSVAISTVQSWGSKNRRTASERRPDKNGLYWSTYNAVSRRDGVYTSSAAGAVDFNQELCDPMEKEFSTEWQSVLDSTIRRLLSDAERNILNIMTLSGQSFAQTLRSNGVDAARLTTMLNTANRSAITALKASFGQMSATAVNAQRDLSRELLPAVQEKMKATYASVRTVPRGTGTFMRMKDAMASNSQQVVNGMFDEAMKTLLNGIQSLIKSLKALIEATTEAIRKTFDNVFSICWDDSQSEALISPEMQKAIRDCRDKLLPELNELVTIQRGACDLLGIEREEVELDVMGVETLEQTLARKKEEAKKNGTLFDLCDSDAEISIKPEKGAKVKAEKRAAGSKSSVVPSEMEVIDLCDSDESNESDDEWIQKPAFSRRKSPAVKEEASL